MGRTSDWLKGPNDSWPNLEVKPDQSLVFSERNKRVNVNVNVNITVNSRENKWYERFSGFSKMIRVLGWVKRIIKNCLKLNVNKEPFLSALDMEKSKNTLLSLVQMESFPETGDSVHSLMNIKDQRGLIRMKTKIIERDDDYVF